MLWRRKLLILAAVLLSLAAALVALRLVTPIYESETTLVLRPSSTDTDDFSFFFTLDAILPIYASAATSRTTQEQAEERLDGADLADMSVETFEQTPLIEIKARDSDPEVAQASAQAVADVLLAGVSSGTLGLRGLRLSQLERPGLPRDPVFPQTALTLAVALILGLALGIGATLLRETLTSRIETAQDLSDLAGVPVFGEIRSQRQIARLRSPELLTSSTAFRGLFESFRDLRTNLQFSGDTPTTVLVTSPEGRHGKTTVAFGLAVTLARAGTRTVLVDGDLRRGRVAEMLRVPRAPGLTEALQGTDVTNVIQKSTLETLDLIPGGRLVDDPGELLNLSFADVLRRLEDLYEAVVIDSTPLVPVNDARIMASHAESTLIVASAGTVKRRQIRAAIERLALVSVQPTAVVLNNSKSPGGDYYYHAA